MSDKVKVIGRHINVKKLRSNHYDYEQKIDTDNPNVAMRQWYNFMMYERAGFIKQNVYTPQMELYEYNVGCEYKKKKPTKKETKERMKVDQKLYGKTIKLNGRKFKFQVHPKSRIPYVVENGEIKTIPKNDQENQIKAIREKEKKNPIAYGGRLKLYYLCDQGLKIDNNEL